MTYDITLPLKPRAFQITGIQGVPGFAFILARRDLLQASKGCARSASLDLLAQWKGLERDGQFCFTRYLERSQFEEFGESALNRGYRETCRGMRNCEDAAVLHR